MLLTAFGVVTVTAMIGTSCCHFKHDSFGTLLFDKKCDLVKVLSAALGRGKSDSVSKAGENYPLGEQNLHKSKNASSVNPTYRRANWKCVSIS